MAILVEDVIEGILDHALYINSGILQNCALVCRSFLLPARKRLFRDVNLIITSDLPGEEITDAPQAISRLQFLASNNCVASFIRRLSFHYSDQENSDHPATWGTTIATLSILYSKLHSIQHVSVHSSLLTDWFRLNDCLAEIIIRICTSPAVDCVELFYVGLPFIQLMLFLRVRKLVLVGVYLIRCTTLSTTFPVERDVASALSELSVTLRSSTSAESIYSLAQAARRSLRSVEWLPHQCHHSESMVQLCDYKV